MHVQPISTVSTHVNNGRQRLSKRERKDAAADWRGYKRDNWVILADNHEPNYVVKDALVEAIMARRLTA